MINTSLESNLVANSQYRNAVASGLLAHEAASMVTATRRYRVTVLTVCHSVK